MRSCIAQSEKSITEYQKHALFLNAVEIYYSAVSRLTCDVLFGPARVAWFPNSEGISDWLHRIQRILAHSPRKLAQLRSDLNSIQYSIHIDGRHVTVGKFDGEPDFSAEVLRIFEKFRQGASKEYQFRISRLA